MVQLSTTYQPDSVTSQGEGQGGGGMAGLNVGSLGPLLTQLAARKDYYAQQQLARQQAEDQAARDEATYRRRFSERQYTDSRNDAHQARDRSEKERQIEQFKPTAERWMKYLPGIGPVEVAPGTFGAYAAGNVDATTDARAAAVGLKPGVVGQNLGYMTAGQSVGGSTIQPALPSDEQQNAATSQAGEG